MSPWIFSRAKPVQAIAVLGSLLLAPVTLGCSEGRSGLLLGPLEKPSGNEMALDSPASAVGGAEAIDDGETTAHQGGVPAILNPPTLDESCSPAVEFTNLDLSEQGAQIESLLSSPGLLLHQAALNVCHYFYRVASEVPVVENFELTLDDFEGVGGIAGTQIRLSTRYLTEVSAAQGAEAANREARGVLHYLVAHAYQHREGSPPDWLVSGKADAARLAAGLLPADDAPLGGHWTDGSRTTAYFLAWLDVDDSAYHLNQHSAPGSPPYDDEIFLDLTGKDLATLWEEYQASF